MGDGWVTKVRFNEVVAEREDDYEKEDSQQLSEEELAAKMRSRSRSSKQMIQRLTLWTKC